MEAKVQVQGDDVLIGMDGDCIRVQRKVAERIADLMKLSSNEREMIASMIRLASKADDLLFQLEIDEP